MEYVIIYLDESKRLGKWEIVIWGFISSHNTTYMEKFIKNKKKDFDIYEWVELKSTNKFGRRFVDRLKVDFDFDVLDIQTFSYHFDSYFLESEESYLNILFRVLWSIFNIQDECMWKKYLIMHDDLNVKNQKKTEKRVNDFLRENFNIKPEFKIWKSKSHLCLQLADLIVWEYKKIYFFREIEFLDKYLQRKDIIKKI